MENGNINSIDEILGVDDCRKFASFRVTSLSRWMSEAYCWTVTFHHSWFLVSCLFSSNRENRSNRGYVEVSKDISQVDGVLIQVRNEWRSLSMGCNVEESRLTNRFIDLSNPLKRKRSARMYILVKAFYQKFDFFSMKKDEVSGWSGWAKLIVDVGSLSRRIRTFFRAFALFSRYFNWDRDPIEISFVRLG